MGSSVAPRRPHCGCKLAALTRPLLAAQQAAPGLDLSPQEKSFSSRKT